MTSRALGMMLALVAGLVVLLVAGPPGSAETRRLPSAELMQLMRQPGHVAFMRHALAPFEGAPKEAGMDAATLGPCPTQRNLDARGRADARRIGELFRASGVVFELIYTSKWCRSRETAELIAGRPVDNLALINSYWTSPERTTKGPLQIAALKRWLNEELPKSARALMVSHGSLIQDLTGIVTDESEIVVVRADGNGGIVVVGHGVP